MGRHGRTRKVTPSQRKAAYKDWVKSDFFLSSKGIMEALESAAHQIGAEIVRAEVAKLEADGHVETGELRDSIGYEVEVEDNHVYIKNYVGALSEEGVDYSEFIEMGSGIYRQGGRSTPWWYRDRDGKPHMTVGFHGDPFIQPAVLDAEAGLKTIVLNEVTLSIKSAFDIARYGNKG